MWSSKLRLHDFPSERTLTPIWPTEPKIRLSPISSYNMVPCGVAILHGEIDYDSFGVGFPLIEQLLENSPGIETETRNRVTHCVSAGVQQYGVRRCGLAIDVESYYRNYGPMVLRRCLRLLKDKELAVDAMQDTFVQLLRNQDRLHGDAPSSLLFRISTNVCLNSIRSARRKGDTPGNDLFDKIASLEEPESRLMARNSLARLFAKEQASTREIAVMHLLDGMTLEEVAQRVTMSVSGVRKRLRPLRSQLQKIEGAGQ